MPKKIKTLKFLLIVAVLGGITLIGCASSSFLSPNPAGKNYMRPSFKSESNERDTLNSAEKKKDSVVKKKSLKNEESDNLDFSSVFEDDNPAIVDKVKVYVEKKNSQQPLIFSAAKNVRVLLVDKLKRITFYSTGELSCKLAGNKFKFRGRVLVVSVSKGYCIVENRTLGRIKAKLPIYFSAYSDENIIQFEEKSYRGFVSVHASGNEKLSLVNILSVEDYLRGVVPLEIGHRDEKYIEAVKAQAVAARTYTYKKMSERGDNYYDLLTTVADQVYGGMEVEYNISDRAILETRGKVLTFSGKIINAYYHSTCGGTTANITDVWGGESVPYLRSVQDKDSNGKSFCSISNYFRWTEKWSTKKLSEIVKRFSKSAYPRKKRIDGIIKGITVTKRSADGRVAECLFKTTTGTYKFGGDKIRFLLRRNLTGFPILRSSFFSVKSVTPSTVIISGRGYGHGIGMCQMGAIARAGAGENYITILKSYYSGVSVSDVNDRVFDE